MAWSIRFAKGADKDLSKLEPQASRRILLFLYERVAQLEYPRSIGEALKGQKLGNFWKYR